MPTNENEYRQFCEYVKRFGHLAEAGTHAINQGATHGPSVLATWALPTFGDSGVPHGADGQGVYYPAADGMSGPGHSGGWQDNSGGTGMNFPGTGMNFPGTGMNYPTDTTYFAEDDSDTSDDEEWDGTVMTLSSREGDEPQFLDTMNPQDVAGWYYQQYKRYKRKWRRFTGRGPRCARGPQRRRHFLAEQTETYYKGGKKGGGKRRGNPIGADGQPLKCHGCGSTEHLWNRCPQNAKGKGRGSSSSSGGAGHGKGGNFGLFTQGPLHGFVTDEEGESAFFPTFAAGADVEGQGGIGAGPTNPGGSMHTVVGPADPRSS